MTAWLADLWPRLAAPLAYDFMREAFVVAALMAVPAALLSCLLVLRGWALLGDAIAHAVLPGVVVAYLIGLPYVVGAVATGTACALATGYLNAHCRVREDTLMGVVFSGLFALGLVLVVTIESDVHLDQILFGDLLGVTAADRWLAGTVAVLVVVVMLWRGRDLLLYAFDPVCAASLGLPVQGWYYGLLVLTTLAIVAALKAVGLALAVAILIAPGAIAQLWTRRFAAMLWLAVAVALAAALAGVYLSFFLDSAPAATIVVVFAAIFVVSFLARARPSLPP